MFYGGKAPTTCLLDVFMAFDRSGRGFSVIRDQISLVLLISTIHGNCEEGGLMITYLLFSFCDESRLTDLCVVSIHFRSLRPSL